VASPPPGPGPEAPEPEAPEPEEPNPARSRRIMILVLTLTALVSALWVVGPIVFAGRDDPTAIDNKIVRKTVLAACTQLRADLAAVPKEMAPAGRAESENRAVDQFLGRIRALGPEQLAKDEPVDKWLADWEQILATRRQAIRDGKHFAIPMVDGTPRNVRMFSLVRSGLEQCDVPAPLLVPEPGRS
jgi:hypothetical protein